jgi:NTE family protein
MEPKEFIEYGDVPAMIAELKKYWQDQNKKITNVTMKDPVDGTDLQFVDLVMEGGGVLGIALVGYTYCLEQVGIRFKSIGGTSAGAINALLLAALGRPDEKKTDRLVRLVANTNLSAFIDGGSSAKKFLDAVFQRAGFLRIFITALMIIPSFRKRLGLNPGNTFLDWLTGVLRDEKITTLADLEQRMRLPDDLVGRFYSGQHKTINDRLAVIATEVTTLSKIRFPQMAELFWDDVTEINPAPFVRASMSVPGFFSPFRVSPLPADTAAVDRWKFYTGYRGTPLPNEAVFLDGGLLSNFPIYVFHVKDGLPKAPTFGVRLGADRDKPAPIDGVGSLTAAALDTIRNVLDYDFLRQNPDYNQLIAVIDTKHHHWLDFNLTREAKQDLFRQGVATAGEFLREFNWSRYLETRQNLIDANRRNEEMKKDRRMKLGTEVKI